LATTLIGKSPADQLLLPYLADLHSTDPGYVSKNGVNTCPPISEYKILMLRNSLQ
jgi:hypothetical protein